VTEGLVAWGPWGLALSAFLAGSVLAAPSEAVLALLVLRGLDPARLVAIASLANVAGTATLLWMAGRGRRFVDARVTPERFERVERALRAWGPALLLFAWVPVIGDAFVLVAGVVRVPAWKTLVIAGIGKSARYAVVAAFAA